MALGVAFAHERVGSFVDCCSLGSRQDFWLFTPFAITAQYRETLADSRSDHDAICSLLIKEGMISAKGLAQEKHVQRLGATCRACPIAVVLDINDIALVATRFMMRDDHAGLRTSSKHMSQSMSATSSAVIPSKILVADVEGPTELFDTTSGRWEKLSRMRKGRIQQVSAVIRGRLYVCGGWGPRDGRVSNSASRFDPLQKGWRSLRRMSVRRSGAASAVVGDHLYVCGGVDVSFRPHNSVERLDTLSEVWEAQPANGQERWGAGAAAMRERIYVVGGGGGDGTKTSSAERFDGAWATVPSMTRPRCFCSTAVIAERLYVCGGQDDSVSIVVERFDPAHDTWELLRPMLHHHVDATVAVLRDRLYLVGGIGDDNIALSSVESYDPYTDSWEESAPMSHARFDAKVARVNGSLYVFGGSAGRVGTGDWSRVGGAV